MTYICHLSGGITSWAAAKRLREQLPDAKMEYLFADTFVESDGAYRMLIEGAADLARVSVPECAYWEIPELNFEDFEPRRSLIKAMSEEAMRAIPGLHWIFDGRHPWEVFKDEKFIGNARIDPCSKALKRKLMDAWRSAHFKPDNCVVCVGVLWDESHRIDRLQALAAPWQFIAPLCAKPWISKAECLQWAKDELLETSEAYALNLAHDNCGGWCVKGGQGSYKQLLTHRPKIYAQHEQQEEITMRELNSEWGILRDRRGGEAKPMTMRQFRLRCERDGLTEDETNDLGGCACALE